MEKKSLCIKKVLYLVKKFFTEKIGDLFETVRIVSGIGPWLRRLNDDFGNLNFLYWTYSNCVGFLYS